MIVKKLTLIPPLLKNIPQPPRQLFYAGANPANWLSRPRVAVVGSRKITSYGKQVTNDLVGELARQGVVIISGLAYGVDAAAMRAALEAGGTVVAVLPSPLDNIVPVSHRRLAQEIIDQGGTLISEYSSGSVVYKTNFIERNRLMSGLADAVLITEAAEKSGSLHTSGFAAEQGRTVFAVPGNITSPMSAGTNQLLKTGALAATNAQDILFELGIAQTKTKKAAKAADPTQQSILNLLEQGVTDGEDLIQQAALETSSFNQALTMLEINGQIRPLGANNWALS